MGSRVPLCSLQAVGRWKFVLYFSGIDHCRCETSKADEVLSETNWACSGLLVRRRQYWLMSCPSEGSVYSSYGTGLDETTA
jgi:hypothetical protein